MSELDSDIVLGYLRRLAIEFNVIWRSVRKEERNKAAETLDAPCKALSLVALSRPSQCSTSRVQNHRSISSRARPGKVIQVGDCSQRLGSSMDWSYSLSRP